MKQNTINKQCVRCGLDVLSKEQLIYEVYAEDEEVDRGTIVSDSRDWEGLSVFEDRLGVIDKPFHCLCLARHISKLLTRIGRTHQGSWKRLSTCIKA